MHSNKSAYETYRNGHWSLLLIACLTAINLLLQAFSVTFFLPFSFYLSRLLFTLQAIPAELAYTLSAVLLLAILACCIIAKRSDRFPAMRAGCILYLIDSLAYFAMEVQDIAITGLRPRHIMELMIRAWMIYTLYQADRVFHDPARKNPHLAKRLKKEPPEEPEERTDEEDEGIQW